MSVVMYQRTCFLLISFLLGGCADWRDVFQGDPNPEQWSQAGGPTRPVPSVQAWGVLDARFSNQSFRYAAPLRSDTLEHEAEATLFNKLVIHVLNIGAGSCQIVQCPHSHRVLIVDCGSSGAAENDLRGEQLTHYVESHGLFSHSDTEIVVTVSHPDQDHTNMIPLLLEGYPVQSIWLGGRYQDYTGPIGNFLDQADQAGIPIYHGWPPKFHNPGHPIAGLQCGAANTYILTVNLGGPRNAQSMVLLLDYGAFRGIFAGDAEQATEEAAYQAYGALMAETTVLLGSHHGAQTYGSNHEAWIAATKPQIVVFSAGNRYGHPRQEVVERYQAAQPIIVASHHIRWGLSSTEYAEHLLTHKPVYVTKENGTIMIRTDGQTWQVACSLEAGCY